MSKIQFWKQITTFIRIFSFEKRCFRYVKDTILKANHNSLLQPCAAILLFPICQRYNFESKSQQRACSLKSLRGCFRYVKDTILKANHNRSVLFILLYHVVSDMSKIQFWKQITTIAARESHISKLFPICQRYNFESKSHRIIIYFWVSLENIQHSFWKILKQA